MKEDVKILTNDNDETYVKIDIGDSYVNTYVIGESNYRENDKPSIVYYSKDTGEATMEIWTNEKGMPSRLTGPAIINNSKEGKSIQKWFIDGVSLIEEEFNIKINNLNT